MLRYSVVKITLSLQAISPTIRGMRALSEQPRQGRIFLTSASERASATKILHFQDFWTMQFLHHEPDLDRAQTLFLEFVGPWWRRRIILWYQNSRLMERFRNPLVGPREIKINEPKRPSSPDDVFSQNVVGREKYCSGTTW